MLIVLLLNVYCFQYVPLIVELCTRIVEARGMDVIGVYRVPGNSIAVNNIQDELSRVGQLTHYHLFGFCFLCY